MKWGGCSSGLRVDQNQQATAVDEVPEPRPVAAQAAAEAAQEAAEAEEAERQAK